MPDVSSNDALTHRWMLVEIAEDERVKIDSDVPMSLDGLRRLQSIIAQQIKLMAMGPVAP